MSKKTKIFFLIGLLAVVIIGLYHLAKLFSPGSYSYAETYELNYSEEMVIKAVKQLKIQHKEMIAPKVTINNDGSYDLNESEGRTEGSYWYTIYFYYPKENQILMTNTRPNGGGKTSFSFVSINNGLGIGHWKEINNDFDAAEKRKLRMDFEQRILKPIKKILQDEM